MLRGTVPDITYANAAEEMAQRYSDASRGSRRRGSPGVRVVTPDGTAGVPTLAQPTTSPSSSPSKTCGRRRRSST
ncbi:MAG: hypothetical protein R3E85_07520 [Planctomycetota bacterium]